MPRNVRNFWLELTVDGAATRVETGPRAKDGGFPLVILQRDGGSITRAMEIDGRVLSDGSLKLTAVAKPGQMGELDREIEVRTVR
jgi:hypothetical protein